MTLWEKYLTKLNGPQLKQNLTVDTLIIGGGISGLATLYFLKDKNAVLVEANNIGGGVTKGTTGKLTFLQENILYKLLKQDYNLAKEYLLSQKEAIKLVKTIIKSENIACDLDKSSSYLLTKNIKEAEKLNKIYQLLLINKIKTSYLTYQNYYGIKVTDTYVFNPIKFVNALAKKLAQQIYEHTKIINIVKIANGYKCLTSDGFWLKCQKVIIACHYPFFLKPMWLPLNTTIEKSFVVVTKEKVNQHYNYITFQKPTFSFRFYEDGSNVYGIYLGNSHNTAFKNNDIDNLNKVITKFNLDKKQIITYWSNVDIMTGDNLPYIGKIEKNMYIATGFNTWGMTNSVLAGKIIRDLINHKHNQYQNLFSPTRLKKYQKIYESIFANTISFFKGINKNKIWYKPNVYVENINGKRVGIYIDQENKLHKVHAICPHLKCPLIFNDVDKTWDCPCHSSRFSIDGKCLKGPSKYDISL